MDCALIYDGEGTAHGFNAEGRVWPWSQKPEWALTAAGRLPDPAADRRRRRGPDGGLVRPQRRADPRDAVHHPSVRLRKRALASGIRPAVTSRVAEITRGGVGARFIRQVAEEPGSLCGIARRRDLMMGLVSYRALVFRVAVVLVGRGSTMTDGIDYF
jgi:hypothetical protein